MNSGLRSRPVEQVVLDLIGDDGGPLLSHGQSEAEQRSFDATCRKPFRFLTAPKISRSRNARSSTATTNRSLQKAACGCQLTAGVWREG